MKSIFRILAAVALVSLLTGCNGKFSSVAPIAAPVVPAAPAVVYDPNDADNHLSTDFYNCHKSEADNVFFSPFSIVTALAMAAEGAAGNTEAQMQKVLYLSPDDAVRQAGFQALIAEINKPGKGYQLSTSNHLWVEQTFTVLPAFENVLVQYYSAGVTNMDFQNNPDGAGQTINTTVSNETNGKINNLIPAGTLTADTRFVLTNAIYFKADWQIPFLASRSFPRFFTLSSGVTVMPAMMNKDMPGAIEDYYGKAQVLEMPYVNNDVSMFVFLPPVGQMAGLEGVMTGDKLMSWFAARVPPAIGAPLISLRLPKFKFETQYDLGDTLKTLGMTDAFVDGIADFSGIDGKRDLSISKVLHKAFVAVDEKGTEAAAATGVVGGITTVSYPPPTIPFVVDHPFFFVIYENNAKAVLFMGKVNDPTK